MSAPRLAPRASPRSFAATPWSKSRLSRRIEEVDVPGHTPSNAHDEPLRDRTNVSGDALQADLCKTRSLSLGADRQLNLVA